MADVDVDYSISYERKYGAMKSWWLQGTGINILYAEQWTGMWEFLFYYSDQYRPLLWI